MSDVKNADVELHGAEKKEAFFLAAEAGIKTFDFNGPEVAIEEGKKLHVKLAATDSCRASIPRHDCCHGPKRPMCPASATSL